jgi:uncharacterized protein YkwD
MAALSAVVMAISLTGVAQASPATNVRPYDVNMLKYVNQARTAHGLKPYKESARLYRVAHTWAAHMAQTQTLAHNPNAFAQIGAKCPQWTHLGENVGDEIGESAAWLFNLYMSDAPHRQNILSRKFTDAGIASVQSVNADGTTSEWDVMDFGTHCA